MQRPRSRGLIALSSTALAMPGIAVADSPPVQSTLSYKFSNYQEDPLSRSEVPFGNRDRYDIDVHQFRLVTPTGRNSDFQLDANQESLSGASPWYNIAGSDGEPQVILSGASGIRDRRTELALGGHYYLDNGILGASVGYSEEDDYRSTYFGLEGQRHFNNEMTTLALSMSYSSDDLFPTDAEKFARISSAHKHNMSGYVSVSQIINPTTVVQTALTVTNQEGYLSDPYKLIDHRPGSKTQLAWATSIRKFVVAADAAVHVNYRYYHDDFGISSQTLDAAWHQNLGNRYQLVPALRYYSQSAADFYSNIDDFLKPPTEYQSSDSRLSAFGAASGSLSLLARFRDWTWSLSIERYLAREEYSFYRVREPGTALVQYTRTSLGIDYSF